VPDVTLPEIISRAEAKARELKQYFSGKLCPYGHVCERHVSDGGCIECKRQRAQNRHKTERGKYTDRRYQQSTQFKDSQRRYQQSEKGKASVLRSRKKHQASSKAKATRQAWYKTDVGKSYNIRRAHRRRVVVSNQLGQFTREDHQYLLDNQTKCHICGKRFTRKNPATLDHIIPVSKGGLHDKTNIVLAHKSCNSKKVYHANTSDLGAGSC
jgi:hypothetical protein